MLDHKLLLNMLFSGSRKVIEHQDELNAINVFPVPDGDTGSNLSYLMRTILQDAYITEDAAESLTSLKKAALRGSRGNSGMIFSQFLIHLANGIKDRDVDSTTEFISVCELAAGKTYDAVMSPEEGTVLTVMKEWVLAMKQSSAAHADILSLIGDSLPHVYQSLDKTKLKMESVSGRKVVDSGAKGFVYFLEGLIQPEEHFEKIMKDYQIQPLEDHIISAEDMLTYRYCTEFMIQGISDSSKIKEAIGKLGDSVVIAGDEQQLKVHFHTNQPETAVDLLSQLGTISFQKVEDMRRQYESIHARKSRIALVVDSACDLPEDFMDHHQIHLLPATIEMDGSPYLDKVTMKPDNFYNRLEVAENAPKTSQPGLEQIFRLYEQLAKHYDHILSIHVSKELSGTYESCRLAADQVNDEKITVLNTKTLSGAYGLLIHQVAEKLEQGASLTELIEFTEEMTAKTEILVSVPTLKHMIRGGRVTPLQGKIATMLKMKPIVSVDEQGKSKLYGKTFFRKSNLKKMFSMIQQLDKAHQISHYVVLHANDPEKAALCANEMTNQTGKHPLYTANVSPVIGAHAGKGSVSVAMLFNKPKYERRI
ncbi:DegV family protein [Mesobacillus thioparans]|uniref:DegV family protein n=1 Tax=Mesobacillus thioparans TaxID=370439 RepID=UPI0039EF6DBD